MHEELPLDASFRRYSAYPGCPPAMKNREDRTPRPQLLAPASFPELPAACRVPAATRPSSSGGGQLTRYSKSLEATKRQDFERKPGQGSERKPGRPANA